MEFRQIASQGQAKREKAWALSLQRKSKPWRSNVSRPPGPSRSTTTVAASRAGPGVSRWAPIGTALDFDFIWDGYDIPFELTRLVRVS